MEKQIEELIAKYNEGLADPSEIRMLEQWIQEGKVALTELRELQKLDEMVMNAAGPVPSMRLDDQFYSFLAEEKKKARSVGGSFQWPSLSFLMPRLAFAAVLMAIGFGGGYVLRNRNPEVNELTQRVSDLKEMVMLSLLEKESTTDRLRAVSLTNEMTQASQKVTGALLKTLNEDENVNVRLAALDALKPYVKDSKVREELIHSISRQDSPMVQVELAELMVIIQEKKSVNALKQILENKKTPKEVKSKIEASLKVLI